MTDKQQPPAPKRIWTDRSGRYCRKVKENLAKAPDEVEYIRADLAGVHEVDDARVEETPSDVDKLLFRLAAKDCEHLAAGMNDCTEELPFADWCVVCQSRGLLQKYSRQRDSLPQLSSSERRCGECGHDHFGEMTRALIGILDYTGSDIQAIKNTAYRAIPDTECQSASKCVFPATGAAAQCIKCGVQLALGIRSAVQPDHCMQCWFEKVEGVGAMRPLATTGAGEQRELLRDAGAIVCVNDPVVGARVEIRFAELEGAQRLHKALVEMRGASPVSVAGGEPRDEVAALAAYQQEYERLFNWRDIWNRLSNSKRFKLATQNERIEAKAARANNLIAKLITEYDAAPTAAPVVKARNTDDLYGVGGQVYTFISQMRNELDHVENRPMMAQRAQELLDAITAHDKEVERIAAEINEECRAEIASTVTASEAAAWTFLFALEDNSTIKCTSCGEVFKADKRGWFSINHSCAFPLAEAAQPAGEDVG